MDKFKKDNINLIVEIAGKIAHDENISKKQQEAFGRQKSHLRRMRK